MSNYSVWGVDHGESVSKRQSPTGGPLPKALRDSSKKRTTKRGYDKTAIHEIGGTARAGSTGPSMVHVGKAWASDPNTGKKPSTGRKALAAFAPGYHGAIAGKKGKKLRAFGNEWGGATAGAIGGQLAGGAIGAAASRGNLRTTQVASSLAGAAGGTAGALAGLNRNQRKGYLKREK